MRRRSFLAGAAAAGALGAAQFLRPAALAADLPADASDLSEDFLQTLFANNSEDIKPEGAAARLTTPQYRDVLADLDRGVAKVAFASTEASPDFFHTGEQMSEQPFVLTAAHLLAMAAANGFDLATETNPRLLFGLRGCRVAGESAEGFGTAVALVEAIPDHYTQRCVLGVLDTAAGTIAVFNASTVPDAAYMYAQATDLEGANMMPTGLYRYQVGTHGAGRPVVEARQPGAWRQAVSWPVRRILTVPEDKVLAYTHAAFWDVGPACGPLRPMTFNNIHAGILDGTNLKVRFSSAGCQTIPGRYAPRPTKPVGPYSRLRAAAGLVTDLNLQTVNGTLRTTTADDGKPFRYMLLTGREARLTATGALSARQQRRVRYGSSGELVARVHDALRSRGFGCSSFGRTFAMQSVAKLVAFQREVGLPPDGIVGTATAAKLNVSL